MEFHISRQARERYQLDDSLFQLNGNVIFANFHAVRQFAKNINEKQDLVNYPERAAKAGQINAMGLIDEIFHYIISLYRQQINPLVMQQALDWLYQAIGEEEVNNTLANFVAEFPPIQVYQQTISIDDYLSDATDDLPNKAVSLEELFMLWLANKNRAFAPYYEFFDDDNLKNSTVYIRVIDEFSAFLKTQAPFGPEQQDLIGMLRSPALAIPYSIPGQLEYIRQNWGELLGSYFYRLLSSLDLIKEEEKLRGLGAGLPPVLKFEIGSESEPERFSPDKDWMPRVVMIAKNIHVWLDQLGKKYNTPIHQLNEIPDEELDILAQRGFTALWLIGLWERSKASAQIKQLCGNPEAIASAYSLSSYSIAADLGGEAAFDNLRERAWQRGIRAASDMVPNHMGIDSPWMIEHPDWFISLDYSPFPSYSFTGANLSPDPNVTIQIEDHYYDRTDAAVAFKRIDNNTGENKYVYHGNDGTNMPWNDTAQLNYLKPEVREAVIQTILSVAKKSPIIRFDAAMTLTKRHYQRLWFPEPGSGGDIPSRSEHAIGREQINKLMPLEFWREVVDRVASEAPDTLLLAEAFWLMEGYFVRTLGMHRVYNSAFMNMLRNEDNAQYRTVMKNTLEFEPEIMKRFVNFMNNPDERTAIDQFGKDDKYFGVCTLLATLPGLPMFGHGQIEGFAEKYGMEYRRSYWDEQPDDHLVERHNRDIFPLLHKRTLFSGVDNFVLYDFFLEDGRVNEDVFAYSNGIGNERALVVFHNKFASTQGWIRMSTGFSVKSANREKNIVQTTLAEGLNLHPAPNVFVIFRDQKSGLEYIHPSKEILDNGLFLQLEAYKYHVFLDLREISDDQWQSYRRLFEFLNGRGVPSIEEALKELLLQPVHQPFRQIANPGYFNYLLESRLEKDRTDLPEYLLNEAEDKMMGMLKGVEELVGGTIEKKEIINTLTNSLETILAIQVLDKNIPLPGSSNYRDLLKYIKSGFQDKSPWLVMFSYLFVSELGKIKSVHNYEEISLSWIDEWQLIKVLENAFMDMHIDTENSGLMGNSIRLLTGQHNWYEKIGRLLPHQLLHTWLSNGDIQRYLQINRYNGILWFNKETYGQFTWWMTVIGFLDTMVNSNLTDAKRLENLAGISNIKQELLEAERAADYKVSDLLAAAEELYNPKDT